MNYLAIDLSSLFVNSNFVENEMFNNILNISVNLLLILLPLIVLVVMINFSLKRNLFFVLFLCIYLIIVLAYTFFSNIINLCIYGSVLFILLFITMFLSENYKQIIPDLEKIEYLPNKDILFFRQVVEIPMLREDAKHCREFFSDEGISRYKNDIKNNEESASKLHNLQEKLLQVILFKYFMEGFNIDDFKKVFFEGMILYKVYEYSFKNIYFDTGDVFNEERIIERIAKIGRILEHTVDEKKEKRNYKIILEKLKENGIYEYDILLEIT